jgi:hypothetical protein
MTVELVNGQLKANVHLGVAPTTSYLGGVRLDDGYVHLVRVLLDHRTQRVRGVINETLVAFDDRLEGHDFVALPAQYVFIGGYPPMPALRRLWRRQDDRKTLVLVDPQSFSTPAAFKVGGNSCTHYYF